MFGLYTMCGTQMERDGSEQKVLFLSLLQLPPLRSRSSDIKPLAEHYAMAAAALRGYGYVTITPAAIRQLVSYPFPGNEDVGTHVQGRLEIRVVLGQLMNSMICAGRPLPVFRGCR